MPYKKYKNNYGWCNYPFENDPLGYCFGFANKVDKKATKEEIRKMCSEKIEKETRVSKALNLKKGDYWCEFFKESGEK